MRSRLTVAEPGYRLQASGRRRRWTTRAHQRPGTRSHCNHAKSTCFADLGLRHQVAPFSNTVVPSCTTLGDFFDRLPTHLTRHPPDLPVNAGHRNQCRSRQGPIWN